MRAVACFAGALALLTAVAAWADPVELEISPVELDSAAPGRTQVGVLEYRGGLRLRTAHPDFGGLSGLWVAGDASRLLAVSDRGHWFGAVIEHDAEGRLAGLAWAALWPMTNIAADPLVPPWTDAESLAVVGQEAMVGFERENRLWRYPFADETVAGDAGATLITRMDIATLNGGIEALTALGDGRLLAIAELVESETGNAAWIIEPGGAVAARLSYRPEAGFHPTGATTLANGDVIVLERRLTLLLGAAARLVLVPADVIVAGAVLEGVELARFVPPLAVDNFEAVAAAPDPDGGTLLFVLSDDNFSVLQRTLLLAFRLPAAAGG